VARPIGPERLLNLGERGLNVMLFIPLGAAVAALPRSRTKLILVVGAVGLPFLIEGIQFIVPALDRSCSSLDVIDNLTGLGVGFVIGAVVGTVGNRIARSSSRSGRTASEDSVEAS
jgi:glycopeptide antibiotics resistance protein